MSKRILEECLVVDLRAMRKVLRKPPGRGLTVFIRRAIVAWNVYPPYDGQDKHERRIELIWGFHRMGRPFFKQWVGVECTPIAGRPGYGQRIWFVCPICGRRCRLLYLPRRERTWACRHCHQLTYTSQTWSPKWRKVLGSICRRPPGYWKRTLTSEQLKELISSESEEQ